MESPQNSPQERAAHATSKTSAQRLRLRAIVDRNADLFDPPNTAEAFARLEAGMDEVSHRSSADSDIAGQNDMLDPPNTAERFARIEAALDAVFAKSVAATWTQRQREKSKFETRAAIYPLGLRSAQAIRTQKTLSPPEVTSGTFTNEQTQMYSESNPGASDRLAGYSLLNRSFGVTDGLMNEAGGPAEGTNAFAGASSKHESQRDSDIFRSSVSVDDFANQAYQSARAKYLM